MNTRYLEIPACADAMSLDGNCDYHNHVVVDVGINQVFYDVKTKTMHMHFPAGEPIRLHHVLDQLKEAYSLKQAHQLFAAMMEAFSTEHAMITLREHLVVEV